MELFTRDTFLPSPAIRPFVAEYWLIRWPRGGSEERTVHLPPDGSVHVVYRVDEVDGDGQGDRRRAVRSGIHVRGATTRGRRERVTCAPLLLGFRLRAGRACALIPIPAAELTDRVRLLEDLRPAFGRQLRQRLDSDLEPLRLIAALDAALASEFALHGDRVDPRVIAAVDSLAHTGQLPQYVAIGERQLRRLFATHVGLSPKRLARIFRFHTALGQGAPAGSRTWAEWIDSDAYADQAHFVREFREMMTLTPSTYYARGGDACPFTSSADELGGGSAERAGADPGAAVPRDPLGEIQR